MKVALVFRTIGERTSDLALQLAREHLAPDEEHILDNCRPFSEAVRRMVNTDFDADYVVAVDADSLILEDMRPWLETNTQPYVDCYVHDRFRGRIHCGVHITHIDVIRKMAEIPAPHHDEAYVLRPESRLRKLALNALGHQKCFHSFRILHDHFQYLRDVWAKYALRELRSRTPEQRRKLDAALARWRAEERDPARKLELRVAAEAIDWAQRELPEGIDPGALAEAIAALPDRGQGQLEALGIPELPPLERADVDRYAAQHRAQWPDRKVSYPVFGLGLSRTGTRSLTAALHVLGVDTVHYPIDADSFRAMATGKLDFQLMESFDGITDIATVPYYPDLAERYPDAKFILTHRDEDAWLRSCELHWSGRDPFQETSSEGQTNHMLVRRLLRAAVYGTYEFEPERFRRVYRKHLADVRRFFADQPGRLLELDIVSGAGWEPLCRFLDRPTPDQPFPHKGGALSARAAAEVDDPDD
ncbi:MAG: sulfotransferase family protein [Sandaracinaceae bacterium]